MSAQLFQKRPVTIEAIHFDGTNATEIYQWSGGAVLPFGNAGGALIIGTLEGTMTASVNDWIIKGVQGEFYPCKPGIFDATYEPEPSQ